MDLQKGVSFFIGTVHPLDGATLQLEILATDNVEGIKLKLIHWSKWGVSLLHIISQKVLCFEKI